MCGIAGYYTTNADMSPGPDGLLDAMTDALAHRGPDGRGTWVDRSAGIGLGHRRLAIIDLSPEGHQPMLSRSQRFVLVFNGEIYNYRALAAQLEQRGHTFRGSSDTEVLLAAIEEWGLQQALRQVNGMLAIALWDRKERVLHLARDRIGKKPLFYGWAGRTLVFGSELKALLAHPQLELQVDRRSLASFLRHNYVPAPWSILQGVFKLSPGTSLSLTAADIARGPNAHTPQAACTQYWNSSAVLSECLQQQRALTAQAATEELDTLLRDAVALRMHADVPLGALLSGGTDSSTVVALMQAQSMQPIRTFSIGFDDTRHDEAQQARGVAEHLGTQHTELYVTGQDALSVVPTLAHMFDEPFADSSQIPTYLVAQLARQSVTVALSGDGGDELFYGYRRYPRAMRVWQWRQRVPRALQLLLARAISPQPDAETRLGNLLNEITPSHFALAYLNRVSRWRSPQRAIRQEILEHPTPFTTPLAPQLTADPQHLMMYLDLVTYLPEDILVKVDRATMAVGLEARAPLLDHRVVELAFRLPMSMKVQHHEQKWLLKQLLRKYLPESLVSHPKHGFGAPVGQWLSGPLQDWAGTLLASRRLQDEGHLDAGYVSNLWSQFVSGRKRWHSHLWNVLMFQEWWQWVRSMRQTALARPHLEAPLAAEVSLASSGS